MENCALLAIFWGAPEFITSSLRLIGLLFSYRWTKLRVDGPWPLEERSTR
jgi:hypothetical protein